MAQQWYFAKNEKKVGPISAKDLRQAADTGELQPGDLVWTEGMKEWKPASSVKAIFFPKSRATTNTDQPISSSNSNSRFLDRSQNAIGRGRVTVVALCLIVFSCLGCCGLPVIMGLFSSTAKVDEPLSQGKLLEASLKQGKPSAWGCVNTVGRVVVPFEYNEIGLTSETLTPVKKSIFWGYVDGSGAEVIKPQFKYAWPFADGLARVKQDDKYGTIQTKWGYVNRDGRIAVAFQFDEATDFENGFAWVKTGSDGYFIDKTGKNSAPTDGRFVPDKEGGRYGLRGSDGQWVVRPQFTAVAATGPDRWVVYGDDRRTGLIDSSGKVIVALQNARSLFQRPTGAESVLGPRPLPVSQGDDLIAVLDQRLQLMGWIDRDGKEVIQPRFFLGPMYFTEGLAAAKPGFDVGVLKGPNPEEAAREQEQSSGYGKAGFIDPKGKWVIPPQFRDARPFWEGLAAVNQGDGENDKWGFIDRSGKIIIEDKYEAVGDFSGGLAWVKTSGRVGYIDQKGQVVVEPTLLEGKNFRGGRAAVKRP